MHPLQAGRKRIIMLGVMAALLFAALNQSIVSMALPSIMEEMGHLDDISWVFTAYILAASVPVVLVGHLSDAYGRRPFLIGAIVLFIIASLFAGLARNYVELIACRSLQGLGGGAIIVTAFSAVGDLYTPRERGRWQGILGSVFALASLLGPAIGGMIVDHGHWKWVFWSPIPLGLIALILIGRWFPSHAPGGKTRLDILGGSLLLLTMLLLLDSLDGEGSGRGQFIAGLIVMLAFIAVERRAQQPILPLSLFGNRLFTLSNLIVFMMGASIFSVLIYLPLFLQKVMGLSASHSGVMMMAMTLALVAASHRSGLHISRSGRYKARAFLGLTLIALGMYLLAGLDGDASPALAMAYLLLLGIGVGTGMPVFNLSLQNAVDHAQLGVATATGQLSRQLGGSFGVALMGMILGQHAHAMAGAQTAREHLQAGLSEVFVFAAFALSLTLVLVALLKEVPLRDHP